MWVSDVSSADVCALERITEVRHDCGQRDSMRGVDKLDQELLGRPVPCVQYISMHRKKKKP